MTDNHDWESWQQSYQAGGRPLPRVLKRAKSDRKRALIGMAIVYAIVAGELYVAIPALLRAHSVAEAAPGIVITIVMAFLVVGMNLAMRSTMGHSAKTPEALLAALERRHAGRRRLIRVTAWGTALAVAGTLASAALGTLHAGAFNPRAAAGTGLTCALVIAFVVFVTRHVRRVIDRELREAEEARRLLAENGA